MVIDKDYIAFITVNSDLLTTNTSMYKIANNKIA